MMADAEHQQSVAPAGQGPLVGLKILEFAGIGPGPFCAMLLSDLGADVLRIDRKGAPGASSHEVVARGRRSIALDLKRPEDITLCLDLIGRSDALIEGFRPGVMERLGLGPATAMAANPRLIYGRMTGWGQEGPLSRAAGHDINYIALTGALASIGTKGGPPLPPLNLVGDFGGGSLYLAMGILAALFERSRSGQGQVIDAAIVDGANSLMSIFTWLKADGANAVRRGENWLGGSAHYYRCYECSDGRYVSVGPIEPHFYALLFAAVGEPPPPQEDWDAGNLILEAIFRTRSRDQWCELLEGTDACFAPVMEFDEAHSHPHMEARGSHVMAFDMLQPAPAPRFSRTPGHIQGPPPAAGVGGEAALADWGVKLRPAEI